MQNSKVVEDSIIVQNSKVVEESVVVETSCSVVSSVLQQIGSLGFVFSVENKFGHN